MANSIIDLRGNKYGKLTVVSRDGKNGRCITWKCICECGNYKVATGTNLKRGDTKSCGCLPKGVLPSNYTDLTGQKYGYLNVLKKDFKYDKWLCKCDCGNNKVISGREIRCGNAVSCGCYKKNRLGNTNRTHGMSSERLYKIWKGIKKRCYNVNSHAFNRYGGKGITICDDWKDNFESFRNWALSNGYDKLLTIDRINNNGIYEPSNCRWATPLQQSHNRNPRSSSKTGVAGVLKRNDKTGFKYLAYICRNGKNKYLGTYVTLEMAAQAREEAEKMH